MTTASVGQAKICECFGLSLSAAVLLVSNEIMLAAANHAALPVHLLHKSACTDGKAVKLDSTVLVEHAVL